MADYQPIIVYPWQWVVLAMYARNAEEAGRTVRFLLSLMAVQHTGRELPSGLSQPGWLGHRDLCPIQWGDPCDCALPLRTTPCVCRYVHEWWWRPAYAEGWQPRPSVIPGSGFRINPRCVHHGDPARAPTPPACTCPGLGTHPDCRRHNTTPGEDGPQPIHDHPHNPYDLDEDERQ